ncbi:MAG: hypothetical protein LC130_04760 [Bryobacterales bacterium]|nr:hypothetical protein [Bryobacterales bacterium]
MLRFYADKAHRHCLPREQYETIISEIERMIEKGGDYSFPSLDRADRGWVFCPDYGGDRPLEIAPSDWDTRVFLFGPDMLPDSDFRREPIGQPPIEPQELPDEPRTETPNHPTAGDSSRDQGRDGDDLAALEPQTPGASRAGDAPSIVLGVDVLTGAEVQWPLTIKGNPHLLIAGLPGMGKMRIPMDADQRSELMSITIPK